MPWLEALAVLGVAVLALVAYQLFLQNGRLILRVEALERRAGLAEPPPPPPGVPVGTVLQDFELPDLNGGRMTLSQWQGRALLLAFVDPACRHCRALAPALAALAVSPPIDRPLPILVSRGEPEATERFLAENGIGLRALLQEADEVAALYRAVGTPSAYLVDARGRTAAPLAIGAEAVLALARATVEAPPASLPPGPHTPLHPAPPVRRDGLPAGTPAPSWRLPRLGGGTLALEELRGARVLLVFSDPQCDPCEELAPRLQSAHARPGGPRVVMVSRRSPEENRAMADRHGLTFPIVLQQGWELSQRYATLAAPVAYALDERAIIAADPAIGADAIRALAERMTPTD